MSIFLALRHERWVAKARCRGTAVEAGSSEAFFPSKQKTDKLGRTRYVAHHAAGKELCRECPVTAECLDYAILHGIADGIWGRVGPGARENIRRARKAERPMLEAELAAAVVAVVETL